MKNKACMKSFVNSRTGDRFFVVSAPGPKVAFAAEDKARAFAESEGLEILCEEADIPF